MRITRANATVAPNRSGRNSELAKRFWSELTTVDFDALDAMRTVAVLPVAATEQHGPHLALATDTVIADGMISLAAARCPEDLGILVLPTQSVGASQEHLAFPGTLSFSPTTALSAWLEIAGGIARARVRKLVLVSSHGGNSEILGLLAREIRVRHRMICVSTSWRRFGLPDGLFSDEEAAYGIHAGAAETSLMLHFRPDLVDMSLAADNRSAAIGMANEFTLLRAAGPHAFGWAIEDLHPDGAVGDATVANAEKGRLIAEHQVAGFLTLLLDVGRFPLDRMT